MKDKKEQDLDNTADKNSSNKDNTKEKVTDKESSQTEETNGSHKVEKITAEFEKISSNCKETLQNCRCFTKGFFDKKSIAICSLSGVIAIICAFGIVKIGLSAEDAKIQSMAENYAMLDNKVKNVKDGIATLDSSIAAIRSDMKADKENSTYIYTNLAALQKDIDAIKKEFNMKDIKEVDETIKNLPPEKSSFLEAFENLVKDGAPFASFLDSYSDRIDIKKYPTFSELAKFSDHNVKSISNIQKNFGVIGASAFNVVLNETFWEKQKRVIKEKITNAIKIRKTDEKAEVLSENLDDKALFSNASQLISDGKIDDCLAVLEKINGKNSDVVSLIKDVKERRELDNAFNCFRKEFIELEKKD